MLEKNPEPQTEQKEAPAEKFTLSRSAVVWLCDVPTIVGCLSTCFHPQNTSSFQDIRAVNFWVPKQARNW
jgi:hypothetical protein